MSLTNEETQQLQQRLDVLAQKIHSMKMWVGSDSSIPDQLIYGAIEFVEKAEAQISAIEAQMEEKK